MYGAHQYRGLTDSAQLQLTVRRIELLATHTVSSELGCWPRRVAARKLSESQTPKCTNPAKPAPSSRHSLGSRQRHVCAEARLRAADAASDVRAVHVALARRAVLAMPKVREGKVHFFTHEVAGQGPG